MMTSILLMTVGLAAPRGAASGRDTLESLEWLCAASDLIAVGHIISVADHRGGGKNRGLVSFVLRGHRLGDPETMGHFGVSVRKVPPEALTRIKEAKTELVVFLRRTAQGYSYDGRVMDLWPLRVSGGGHWMVSVAAPEPPIVTARGFRALVGEGALAQACQQKPVAAQPSFAEVPRAYLSVPKDAPAAKTLGARVPAQLIVPAASFPGAASQPSPPKD